MTPSLILDGVAFAAERTRQILRILLITLVNVQLVVVATAHATEETVLDPLLKVALAGAERPGVAGKASSRMAQILLRGDVGPLAASITAAGGQVGSVVGDILTARVPLAAVRGLAVDPATERIEQEAPLSYSNDILRSHIGADRVQAGEDPLDRSYTGKGVILGVIDTGIDILHPDFRDPVDTTRSRILSIWDMEDPSGPPPVGYSYGTEWTRGRIEAVLRGEAPDPGLDTEGHGSHVAGTAAGNGSAVGRYGGVAPEADLIVVKFPFEQEGDPAAHEFFTQFDPELQGSLIDAATYIYGQAQRREQPAVINLSAGSHMGPHDGSTLVEQALDTLLETPGRAFCAAAGNEGIDFIHWGGFELEADSVWTYFYMDVDALALGWIEAAVAGEDFSHGLPIDIGLYGTADAGAELAIGFEGMGADFFEFEPLGYEGQTPWRSAGGLARAKTTERDSLLYGDGRLAGIVEWAAQPLANGKVVFVAFVRDSTDGIAWNTGTITGSEIYRVMARGSGRLDLWAELGTSGTELGIEAEGDRFLPTDWDYSVGLPATARSVIAVGAYANIPVEDFMEAGELAGFTSTGPTLDGRLKPEITAPGQDVISAHSRHAETTEAILEFLGILDVVLAPEGRHIMQSGTSMSTPAVAGAVALYLERFPGASNQEIRDALLSTAADDEFTNQIDYFGALPNNYWGYGKLDVFAAMTEATPTYVATALSAGPLPASMRLYQNHPNPFNPNTAIRFDWPAAGRAVLLLFNLSGQLVGRLVDDHYPAGTYTVTWDGTDGRGRALASGIYAYKLEGDDRTETRKLLLLR